MFAHMCVTQCIDLNVHVYLCVNVCVCVCLCAVAQCCPDACLWFMDIHYRTIIAEVTRDGRDVLSANA